MGIGIALGGIAKGLESAENARLEQKKTDILDRQAALRMRELGLREDALGERFRRGLLGEADKLIAGQLGAIDRIISEGKKAGRAPEQIAGVIEPPLQDIETISTGTGRDGSVYRRRVNALLSGPTAGEAAAGTKIDEAKALEAAGVDPQTARAAAGISRRAMSPFDAALIAGAGGLPAPAPASPAAAFPDQAAAKSFASEAELQAAFKRGEVQLGDTVTVGGQRGTFR